MHDSYALSEEVLEVREVMGLALEGCFWGEGRTYEDETTGKWIKTVADKEEETKYQIKLTSIFLVFTISATKARLLRVLTRDNNNRFNSSQMAASKSQHLLRNDTIRMT